VAAGLYVATAFRAGLAIHNFSLPKAKNAPIFTPSKF
jgi:hypothetical protein